MAEKSKWMISIIISICIAVGGWTFGFISNANAESNKNIVIRVERVEQKAEKNSLNNAVIGTKLDNVICVLNEIKEELKKRTK